MSSLNKEQNHAYKSIVELFSAPSPSMAILTGAAGTGKTYLTDALAAALNPVLSAMTNKAAAVMSAATEKEVITLAKVLKQRKYNDRDTGKTHFRSMERVALPDKKDTLFIDETSMMNIENLEQVIAALSEENNILFIGDKFQLPPVGEDFATVFTQEIPRFELTEPMRFNPDSGIAATAISIRTAMAEQAEQIDGMRDILKEFDDVEWISSEEAVPRMIEDFKKSKDVNDVRMISFTNARVESFNYHLKLAVTGDADKFKVGDVLVANSAYGDDEGIILYNNQDIKVASIKEEKIKGIPCFKIRTESGEIVYTPVDMNQVKVEVDNLRNQALSYPKGSKERSISFAKMFQLQESFADLRLNYAQTVHKSQGSSYQTCYFDMAGLNSDTVMGRHLLYTGVTRAAKKLVLFK